MLVVLIALGSYIAGAVTIVVLVHGGHRKPYPKRPDGPYDPWEI